MCLCGLGSMAARMVLFAFNFAVFVSFLLRSVLATSSNFLSLSP